MAGLNWLEDEEMPMVMVVVREAVDRRLRTRTAAHVRLHLANQVVWNWPSGVSQLGKQTTAGKEGANRRKQRNTVGKDKEV
jgi:hypothetical protein